MSDQVNNEDEVVPIPPKGSGSGSGNKVLLIILGVIVACILVFGVVLTAGVMYVKNRGANIVKDIAKTQGVDIKNYDAKNGTAEYSIKTKDGEISSKVSKELPDDFPSDIMPVFQGTIDSTNRMKMGNTSTWSVTMDSDVSYDAASDAIKKELENHGWEIVMEQESDGRSVLSAKRDDYSTIVSVHTRNDKTRIGYNVTHRVKDQQ